MHARTFEARRRCLKCQYSLVIFFFLLTSCGGSNDPHYQGYVEGENTFLASPYGGVLIKKVVHRGQRVKKGDLLLKLDPNPEAIMIAENEAELLQAKKVYKDLFKPKRPAEIAAIQAQIEQTKAQIRLAALRVSRTKQLYERHAIDKDSADEALAHYEEQLQLKAQYEANLDLAKQGGREEQLNAQQAQIQALIAKLKQVKWQLAQKVIYAPTDGVIFDTYFVEGEYVPNQQAVLSLLSPNNVRIEFFVPEQALKALHLGQKISFSCETCEKEHLATIQYISPEAEYIPPLIYSDQNLDKLVFRIKAHIDNPSAFKPGQPVIITSFNHAK